jgi:hypothetical protein
VPIGPFAQAPIVRPDEVRRSSNWWPRLKCGSFGTCRIAAISAMTGIDTYSDEAAQSLQMMSPGAACSRCRDSWEQ